MSKIKAILDQHQNLNCNVFHVSSFFCLPPCQSLAVPLLWQSSCHVLTSYIVTKKTNFRLSTCLQLLRTCSCWWWWMDCRNTETSYGLGTLWSKTKPWLIFRLVGFTVLLSYWWKMKARKQDQGWWENKPRIWKLHPPALLLGWVPQSSKAEG